MGDMWQSSLPIRWLNYLCRHHNLLQNFEECNRDHDTK